MQISDEDIINSILSGDNQKALQFLYDSTLRKVRGYILKNSGGKEEANDIFQDAVIIFMHKVKTQQFDKKYSIEGFIYAVSRNLWIDRVRREKKKVNYEYPDQIENPAQENDALVGIIQKEQAGALTKAFSLLDQKCQDILKYHLYEKLSMKEISVKMGYKSENVAKTNHYRCKQYLTKIVKEDSELLSLLRN